MTESKKMIPENNENKLLTDDQLENVSGGEETIPTVTPVLYKRCTSDSTNVDGKELYEHPLNNSK